jgi:hypothetical protein
MINGYRARMSRFASTNAAESTVRTVGARSI